MNLTIVYPELPPTSNKIYFQGTRLTAKARKYKSDFSHYVVQKYLSELGQVRDDAIFALHLRFYFSALENKNWDHPDPKKRPKSRYKRIDLDNRIKLLQDCVKDALAVDDSHIFAASQEKHQGPVERVEITIHEVDPSLFGLG